MTGSHKLQSLLTPLLETAPAPALLFSGGLRSSLLASLGGKGRMAISMAVPGHALDEPFVPRAAEALGLTVAWIRPEPETLLDLLPQTIKILKTFEPAVLRPALVAHAGILLTKEFHLGALWSGEADHMRPGEEKSSLSLAERLGHSLGLSVHTPLRHPTLRNWWARLPPEEKTLEAHGRKWDQGPLRGLLAETLPPEIAFRDSCPAAEGAGTRVLAVAAAKKVTDAEFARDARAFREEDGADLRDKEHLLCYRLYRSQFGPPPKEAAT